MVHEIKRYSTCPQSKDVGRGEYLARVAEVSRWSEDAGFHGMLVYTDNGIVDPWLVSQIVIEHTTRLAPLVAVQPVYMHPYAVAKIVTSIAYLHGRPLDLNMLAGGFKNDLIALGDDTPHDDRYARTVEYTNIVAGLLRGESVTSAGAYYKVENLRLEPPLPEHLYPGLVISGSSPAGVDAARAIGATAIRYPEPPEEEHARLEDGITHGVRVGIIAREDAAEAWGVALERFPEDRKGQIAHALAMKVSDSHWHRQLSARDPETGEERSTYWLGPFRNYKTFCPYLVGSYDVVAQHVAEYVARGFESFILDIPASREELQHSEIVFERVRSLAA
jgi:alkanesulfonate monooxygenase